MILQTLFVIHLALCYIIYKLFITQFMQEQVEKVKILTLKDNKNKEEKYMLTSLLGKGKYGKVFKAIHVDNPNKIFAVKVITLQTQKIKDECLKELQIVRHLPKSLNLVQIHSQHLQSNNNFYLFEEFCQGGNLLEQKRSRKGQTYSQSEVFNLFFQIVNGFILLRKHNIFHEDIKPENIMIKNNLYKITDFGISQLAGNIEVSAIRKGTLIYMPPEKLKGETFTPTSKTQIFSLGVTLYEIIFGHHPYLRKRPQDYRQYLKLIQQVDVKSVNQLKSVFPSPSLSIDRLIRTILRMIDLSQAKRLSLQQLEDYIKNTEPFKSMVVSQIEPIAKKKIDKNIKYQQVGHSYVYVKSQNGIGQILQQTSFQKKQQKLKSTLRIYSQIMKLFREVSSYLQQGIFYCKDCNIHELKKITSSQIGFNKVQQSKQIQFMTLLLIERMFTQLENIISRVMFSVDFQVKDVDKLIDGIAEDKEFAKNQFLNFYMELQNEDKKAVWTTLKEKKDLAALISKQLKNISQNTDCIRINFKQDMLSLLFTLQAPSVLQYTQSILQALENSQKSQQAYDSLESLVSSQQGQKIKISKILQDFNKMENLKKEKLYVTFHEAIEGHQILQDDETNSDQFQVLSLDDL